MEIHSTLLQVPLDEKLSVFHLQGFEVEYSVWETLVECSVLRSDVEMRAGI